MDDVLLQLWTIRERGPDGLIRVSCHVTGRGWVWKRLLTDPLDAERLVLEAWAEDHSRLLGYRPTAPLLQCNDLFRGRL